MTLLYPSAALAQQVTGTGPDSAELVEDSEVWDGRRVEFQGEIIGEAMVRGEWAWIHINDDAYQLRNIEEGAEPGGYNTGHAVWIDADRLKDVVHYGDYHNEGDIVRVAGVFNAACAQHGGDMDIHADNLEVVRRGRRVVDPISPTKAWWAAVLSVVAAAAYGLYATRRPGVSRWPRVFR